MRLLMLLPFLIQAIAIGIDEVYFHIKRDLPKWERIGHPLDTLSVLACFLFVLLMPDSPLNFKIYLGLAILSCLFITKDEFVHKHHCPAGEQWLHALLFVNHSIVLTVLAFLWSDMETWIRTFLWVQTAGIFLFLLYQIIYWNICRTSTTTFTKN